MSHVFRVLELTQPPYHPTLSNTKMCPLWAHCWHIFVLETQPSPPTPSLHLNTKNMRCITCFFVFGGLPTPSLHPHMRTCPPGHVLCARVHPNTTSCPGGHSFRVGAPPHPTPAPEHENMPRWAHSLCSGAIQHEIVPLWARFHIGQPGN